MQVENEKTKREEPQMVVQYKEGGYSPGDLFKLLGRVWRVEAAAHTGKAITAHTANDGKFMRRQFAISAPVYPTYTT